MPAAKRERKRERIFIFCFTPADLEDEREEGPDYIPSSLYLRYPGEGIREVCHYGRIVPRYDKLRIRGELLHAVLCAKVRIRIECRRDRHVLLEVLVQIHVVAGQHDDSRRSGHS